VKKERPDEKERIQRIGGNVINGKLNVWDDD